MHGAHPLSSNKSVFVSDLYLLARNEEGSVIQLDNDSRDNFRPGRNVSFFLAKFDTITLVVNIAVSNIREIEC